MSHGRAVLDRMAPEAHHLGDEMQVSNARRGGEPGRWDGSRLTAVLRQSSPVPDVVDALMSDLEVAS